MFANSQMDSVGASLSVELQESQWPQFLSEHQTISHVRVGSGVNPVFGWEHLQEHKRGLDVWTWHNLDNWVFMLQKWLTVLNKYLITSLSDCTDLLSLLNFPFLTIKDYTGEHHWHVYVTTPNMCVHTANTGQTRGARSNASRHVSETKNVIWTAITGTMK